VNGIIVHPEILFRHTENFIGFDFQVICALSFYQDIIDYERKKLADIIDLKYLVHGDNAIIRLVTSLEVYLVDSFKMISKSFTLGKLDPAKLADFIEEFRIQKKSDETLKTAHGEITLDMILPERIDLQQKDECKKAYSLIGTDVMTVAGNDFIIWDEIFNKSNGYIKYVIK